MGISTLRADLVRRVIVNYALDPKLLEAKLPCSWMRPQLIRGAAIASFCVLDLERITVGAMPSALGIRNLNCAHRFGIVDARTGESAVYVESRNTNSSFGALLTKLGCPGRHGLVRARMLHEASAITVEVKMARTDYSFALRAHTAERFESKAFGDLDEFASFMSQGVRSYAPSRKEGFVTIVDLFKPDPTFQPIEILEIRDSLIESWTGKAAAASLDSAVMTDGGTYLWKYHGLAGQT
jgi:hypothetical protein